MERPGAQAVLNTLDAARKQRGHNEKLKAQSLEAEAILHQLHCTTFAQKHRGAINRAHQKATALLKEVDEGLRYQQLRKFNVNQYMVDCGQEMPLRDLCKPDDAPNTEDMERAYVTLKSLRSQGQSSEKYHGLVDSGVRLLEKILGLLKQSNLHSGEWAKVTDPLLVLLKDVMHADPVEHCLIEADEDVKRMKFNVEECTQAQAKAITDGEMAEAEALYYQKIQMQETASELIKKKVGVLEGEEVAAFKVPLKRVHETHNRSNVEISNVLKSKERLKKRTEDDLARLTAEMERVNLEDYNGSKAFTDDRERSTNWLRQNFLHQEALWKKMEELEKELSGLGEARFEEIKRRTVATEREEIRKVEYTNFLEFVTQHKKLLELTVRNCELGEEITDTLDEFVSSGCNAIERRMRETEKELQDLKMGVHEEYYEAFRHMYLTIGDLTYKKEKAQEEVDKKIHHMHIQQELAMDTLNPKAKEYAQQKKSLQKSRLDLESQVDDLRGKATLYVEWFQTTEKALIESGREFKHPVEELKEINDARQHKLIEYEELMARQEDDQAEYAQEMAEIERLRALTGGSPHLQIKDR